MKASSACLAAVLAIAAFASVPVALALDDVDIFNFALNLEYLEASYYSYALYGKGLDAADRGGGPQATGGMKADLSSVVKSVGMEIAEDEIKHVKLIRLLLGKAAVPMPEIDIGSAFAVAADAALNTTLKPPFSPYAGNLVFLHGAFIFEDVGVTAYKGAANLIKSKNLLQYAAGVLAVEAYHAGTIRSMLFRKADTKVAPYGAKVSTIVGAISALRAKAGGGKDQGILGAKGNANIVPTNGNALAYGRTPTEVLSIVTLGAKGNKGGFFPKGLNGNIK